MLRIGSTVCRNNALLRGMSSISGSKFLKQQAFIEGQWVGAADGKVMDVRNPANGEKIAQVPVMKREDVARACQVAHAAWGEWKNTTAKVLFALFLRACSACCGCCSL